jgi:hypothetical protein
VDSAAVVHPGIRHFGLDRRTPTAAQTLIEPITDGQIFDGFMPGDVVSLDGERQGIVAGMCHSRIVVQMEDRRVIAQPEKITLKNRDGFHGVAWNDRIVDGGRALELFFGLRTREIVRHIEDAQEYEVIGIGAGGLCLQSTAKNETLCVPPDLYRFFSKFTCKDSEWTETIGGVNFPIRSIPRFFALVAEPVEIIGEFALFYLGRSIDGKKSFYKKTDCHPIEGNGEVFAHDWALCECELGTILSVCRDTALFLTLTALANGECARVVPVSSLTVVATIAGPQSKIFDATHYSLGLGCLPFLAGDLVVTENGFATILGSEQRSGSIGAGILARGVGDQKPFLLDVRKAKLVWRLFCLPSTAIDFGDLRLSVRVQEFAGFGCLPGDEVLFRGETPAVVAGLADGYLWLIGMDGQMYCATAGDSLSRFVSFAERPTSHSKILLNNQVV